MPRFRVTMDAKIWVTKEVEVETEDADEAEQYVLDNKVEFEDQPWTHNGYTVLDVRYPELDGEITVVDVRQLDDEEGD